MEIVSVGSSSSGNAYIIKADGHVLILDAGLTAKSINGALSELDIKPEEVDAVLITHEHTDHVRSVRAVARKCCNAKVFASRGTILRTPGFAHIDENRICPVGEGEIIELEGLTISTFPLSHDAAEPLGFAVESGGEKLAAVTDTGVITDEIYEAIRDSDMLVFESNHDEDMLMFGDYPYTVKVRIKSDHGHLSNDYAAKTLTRILAEREADGPLRIMLAHLSFNNNIPLFARQTVEDALSAAGFHRGKDYLLEVAAREGLTRMPALSEG